MLSAGLLFVAVTVMVRHLGSDLPAVEAAFIRYLFGLIFLIPVMLRMRWRSLSRENLGVYSLRGLAHGAAVMLWFFAMARIPLAEVTAIGFTTPIFTTIGAMLIFHEKLRARRIMAIVIGFLGMLIILRPGFESIEIGSLAQLVAAPCFAISFLFTKRLTRTENASEILLMLSIFCTLALLPGALLYWRTPTPVELGWLALVAVFATAGHYAMTRAIAYAPLSGYRFYSWSGRLCLATGYLMRCPTSGYALVACSSSRRSVTWPSAKPRWRAKPARRRRFNTKLLSALAGACVLQYLHHVAIAHLFCQM